MQLKISYFILKYKNSKKKLFSEKKFNTERKQRLDIPSLLYARAD